MMAETTSIDARVQNGHTDLHSPRARKPTRIDLLKPHLGDDLLKVDGAFKDIGSGMSRHVEPRQWHSFALYLR
jgi:sterol O-acyltransferase